MHRPNTTFFVRFSLAATSFLAGIGCEAYWRTPAPVVPPDRTQSVAVDDHSSTPPAEKPSAADIPEAGPVKQPPIDAWARAEHEGDRLHRAHRFENLGASLTRMDPREALRVIAETAGRTDRSSLLSGFFGELAQGRDAPVAIELAMQLASRDERETALAALVDGWTTDSPDPLGRRAALITKNDLETGLGMELLDSDPPKLDLALAWATRIKDADGQTELLSAIARRLVSTDPVSAIALGSTLTGNRYVDFLRSTLESWAQFDPSSALAWTAQITDPAIRQAAQESVGSGWAQMDDERTGLSYLGAIAPGPARTEFIRAMMQSQQTMHSPDEVNAWIAQLNDPADRATAQALVEDAPAPIIGIGARLILDNGTVLVGSVVPDSPAERGGLLKPGDRILAVAQPGEALLSVSGVDLDTVACIIRGASGSDVQLQVASPQPGGYGAPHLVQFTRASLDPDR